MTILHIVIEGIKKSLEGFWYKILFISSALILFFVLVLIPAQAVPGNTFSLQLTLFTSQDYIVIIFLALLYALFITMQVFLMRFSKRVASGVGSAVGGGVGAVFAGVAGTAFCVSCLAPLFAFFGIGFGGVLFVLEYRIYFVVAISILMAIAIYFTARRIVKIC